MDADDGSDVTRLPDDDADDREPDWVQIRHLLVVMVMTIRRNIIILIRSIMMTMQKRNTGFFRM
jgi:hypothetical protein